MHAIISEHHVQLISHICLCCAASATACDPRTCPRQCNRLTYQQCASCTVQLMLSSKRCKIWQTLQDLTQTRQQGLIAGSLGVWIMLADLCRASQV